MIVDTLKGNLGRYFFVRELWDGRKNSIIGVKYNLRKE